MAIRLCCMLLTLAVLSGCRYRQDPTIDLMQGEMRWLEDQVYLLESELEQSCYDLCRCRQRVHDKQIWDTATQAANAKQSAPPVPAPAAASQVPESPPVRFEMPSLAPDSPSSEFVAPETIESPPLGIPYETIYDNPFEPTVIDSPIVTGDDSSTIDAVNEYPSEMEPTTADPTELPAPMESTQSVPSSPQGSLLAPESAPQPEPAIPDPGSRPIIEGTESDDTVDDDSIDDLSQLQPPGIIRLQSHFLPLPVDRPEPELSSPVVDAHVTHIVVEAEQFRRQTSRPGTDLQVRIEPRNADGNYVELPAAISIVVLDRNQIDDKARVARWDFDATETATKIGRVVGERGIHVDLQWPETPPSSDDLYVYVRYETVDGRKLQASRKLDSPIATLRILSGESADDSEKASADDWKVVNNSTLNHAWEVVDLPAESTNLPAAFLTTSSPTVPDQVPQTFSRPTSQPNMADANIAGEPSRLPASVNQGAIPMIRKAAQKPTWQPYR